MTLTKEYLNDQLATFEKQLEEAKANLYRLDAAVQVTKAYIAQLGKEDSPIQES